MEDRKKTGTGDGEKRHRFGKAIDRSPPLLMQKQQDRRYQCAGMANPDPPDKVDYGESPGNRNIDAPYANPANKQVANRHEKSYEQREGDSEADEPAHSCRPGQNNRTNFVRDRSKCVTWSENRLLRFRKRHCLWPVVVHVRRRLTPDWDCAKPRDR
jgi:hypothetical protein